MADAPAPDHARYRIVIDGAVPARWASWFDGMTIDPTDGGQTVLEGTLADQAALHGLLARVRDLGLILIAVERLNG